MNSIALHPYCSAIPEMAQEDYKSLKSDISGSGVNAGRKPRNFDG